MNRSSVKRERGGSHSLLVGVFFNVNDIVGHGLVGQLVQDGTDWVEASLHYEQLGLGLFLTHTKHIKAKVNMIRGQEGHPSDADPRREMAKIRLIWHRSHH